MLSSSWITIIVIVLVVLYVALSFNMIGPTEVGLVGKRIGRGLREGHVIAFKREAGYQANLLMPGLRFRPWLLYSVKKFPWVQVPADGIGVVIAQVGTPLPPGAKSALFKPEFGNFSDVRSFLDQGGEQGVQRPVLPPGSLVPMHPVGFLVLTYPQTFGFPVSPDMLGIVDSTGGLTYESFGLQANELQVVRIAPEGENDYVGVVTTLEGNPLPSGDIAGRLGGFEDVRQLEADGRTDPEMLEVLLGSKNDLHNNYQDFQRFLDNGGKIGLQHDPLLYGAFLLNPFLVKVERAPMLVVNQGQVAVIKSYLGLSTQDTSGQEFKFGSIVRPGHRGIWSEPLRTGKYPLNPRVYRAEIVPTAILTLNWAEATSHAHNLDAQLSSIDAKSREGFSFLIDLQVQIHVPDTMAPKVISMVETMLNLVNEVLQSAVGNYFRNTLQGLPAVQFIETRQEVQDRAERYITEYLGKYSVETKGVYIQDVVLPEALVEVLSARELAVQQRQTFAREQEAQQARISVEKAKGTADAQLGLARAQVDVDVQRNNAAARTAEAEGEANFTRMTGEAVAARTQAIGVAEARAIEAQGLARAVGYEAQTDALGAGATAVVAVAQAVSEGHVTVVPEVLVTGGGGSIDGLAGTLMKAFAGSGGGGNGLGTAKKALDAVVEKVEKEAGAHRSVSEMIPEPPPGTASEEPSKGIPPPPASE
jgi:regulator of protease activity HflC (stomatin/prohibitin superfamily)